jgi:hypothetical protein
MDLRLFGRVLWRFKLLVIVGFLIALALSILSTARVSSKGLTYRNTELFSANTQLGVTQNGFPWGRLFAETPSKTGVAETAPGIPVANPDRLNSLAVLYAELATSDPVRALMRLNTPIKDQITAVALRDESSGTMLPLIDVTAIAPTPTKAVALAKRAAGALETYVARQQQMNNVPESDRVIIQEVVSPKKVHVYRARSKTMPVVVFLGVMFAFIGLAFLLENLRPRRIVVEPSNSEFASTKARLTA